MYTSMYTWCEPIIIKFAKVYMSAIKYISQRACEISGNPRLNEACVCHESAWILARFLRLAIARSSIPDLRAKRLLHKNRASARQLPPSSRNFNQDALDRIDVTPFLALHQCYRKQQGNPFRIRSKLSIAITLVRSATSERRHVMDQ